VRECGAKMSLFTGGVTVPEPGLRVLVTGATGFVGRHLRVGLEARGYEVTCCARDVDRARNAEPLSHWVHFDVRDPESFKNAVAGCNVAFYLVHRLGTGEHYPEEERRAAQLFAQAAAAAGVSRVVYLGGVAPSGKVSRHLASRLATGDVLRAGTVEVVELRAAMIVGKGSVSWQMVRDLARRLPAMLLPKWLLRHSWPVSIDDVTWALVEALSLPSLGKSVCYDLPGPERISHRDMLLRAARATGRPNPAMIGVPVLTPRLSSYWIGWVTTVETSIARELVEGLVSDLEPTESLFWALFPGRKPLALDVAMHFALADESSSGLPSPATRKRLLEACAPRPQT